MTYSSSTTTVPHHVPDAEDYSYTDNSDRDGKDKQAGSGVASGDIVS